MTAPTGEVTLVFTDVQSSCALWEAHPIQMREALFVHDAAMRQALADHAGFEVKTEGDAFMAAFADASDAAAFCFDVQETLRNLSWPPAIGAEGGLQVRMGFHRGRPHCEVNPVTHRMDYLGPMVNRAARIASCAHGGQILACGSTLVAAGLPVGARSIDHGIHKLKGLSEPVHLVEVEPIGRLDPAPAPRSISTDPTSPRNAPRDLAVLLPDAAEALLARGQVRLVRGGDDSRRDFALAQQIALAADRPDIERRTRLALLSLEVQLERSAPLKELDALAAAARRSDDPVVLARALLTRSASCIARLEQLESVLPACDEAYAIGVELGDPDIRIAALVQQGLFHRRQSRIDEATAALEQALAITEDTGTTRHFGRILSALARIKSVRATPDVALAQRALVETRRARDAVQTAWALHETALHMWLASDDRAVEHLEAARATFETLGYTAASWRSSMAIALAHATAGRVREAEVEIDRAMRADTGQASAALAKGAFLYHRAWVRRLGGRTVDARSDVSSALSAFRGAVNHPLHRAAQQLLEVLDADDLPVPRPEATGLTAGVLRVVHASSAAAL